MSPTRPITCARSAHRVLPAAVALTACLLAAGCSSSTNKKTLPSASPATPGSSSAQAGAGSSAPASASAGSSQSVAVSITIKDFAFTVSAAAAAGAMVQVTNNDSEAHSVTADAGNAFDLTIQPGTTKSLTAPKRAGSYKFHCMFHSNMHGTLTIAG